MFAPFRWLAGVVAVLALVSSANAAIYGFTRISNNSSSDVSSQLSVDVTDAGGGYVDFTFYNNVGTASSICDIYFDDGTLLGISSITDSGAGVAFDDPANPADLSGGNAVNFETTQSFSADSNAPVSPNGVDSASEWVTIRFELINGKTFADTLAALELAGTEPENENALRIGLHVQASGSDGESDAYVNTLNSVNHLPEPSSIIAWLLCSGLGLVLRSRMKKNAA